MKTHHYTISKLTDYAQLGEIHQLTHDTLVEIGHLIPRVDRQLANFSRLDRNAQTTILVAQRADRVIGTISVSADGPDGLVADRIFKEETQWIRHEVPHGLGSTWRIATSGEYRSERSLVIDLIRNAFSVCFERHIDTCLLVPVERHVPIYRRILGAEVVAQKSVSLDGTVQSNAALLRVDVPQAWKIFLKVAGT